MTRPHVTHVLRAPVVGGSELETAAITRWVPGVDHEVIFPAAYADWAHRVDEQFAPTSRPRAVARLQEAMDRAPGVVHLQFPFVLVDRPRGHDSVLELASLPSGPVLFTVHAAVNVPVVPGLHYLFHTASLAARFADRLLPEQVDLCPSLVPVPRPVKRPPGPPRLLWVSRDEEAKFNDAVPDMASALLRARPDLHLRFVGRPSRLALPDDPRVSVSPCPVPDLSAEYAAADLLWYYPHRLLQETWCRVVTEAMAHGLPCVVASWGAMGEQVGEQAGCLVSTPRECVAAVLSLLDDPERRARAGARGRQRAQGFFNQARSTLEGIYERLDPSRPARAR